MLIHPTVDRLRALGLAAMADTFVELQNNPEAAESSPGPSENLLSEGLGSETLDSRRQEAAVTISPQLPRQRLRSILKDEIASFWAVKARKLAISKPISPGKSILDQPLGRFFTND
ncbi:MULTISPECIES: hypothetical protein [Bradyrhizobium]|uniref:hypothetical protein n=1 Tax=Bradyrhizobium TaxID=374 RepID=UPI001652EFBB|nr:MULTISPECIES: hypothetical protein [Bradyrhizobium]